MQISKRRVECKSEFHEGDRFVYTDEFIRKGQKYYCDKCREKFKKDKYEQLKYIGKPKLEEIDIDHLNNRIGKIKKIFPERGFGFIEAQDGDYYFHYTDITGEKFFKEISEQEDVIFDVVIAPDKNSETNNGKAVNIRFDA